MTTLKAETSPRRPVSFLSPSRTPQEKWETLVDIKHTREIGQISLGIRVWLLIDTRPEPKGASFEGIQSQSADLVRNRFHDALDYHNYCVANQSSKNAYQFAKSVVISAERVQLQMKKNISHSFDSLSLIGFSSISKLVFNTKRIHEGRDMLLLHYLMRSREQPPYSLK